VFRPPQDEGFQALAAPSLGQWFSRFLEKWIAPVLETSKAA
jgi:hypothetical protein